MSHAYLEDMEDNLPMRSGGDYAKDKLRLLAAYLSRFIVAMRRKPWRAISYIDLQAGPGKNVFTPSGDIMCGSPLIALKSKRPFDNYWFVELGDEEFQALEQRSSVSDRTNHAHLINGDCNVAIDPITQNIQQMDSEFIQGQWSSLNLAFLDPEGLELNWSTVEKLGQIKHMDLIINFSTSGVTRNIRKQFSEENTILDTFFGTTDWREIYAPIRNKDKSIIRRQLIDFYRERLKDLGYVNQRDYANKKVQEKVFKNRRNVQLYTLIFASKHTLGIEFWNQAINDIQPRLF